MAMTSTPAFLQTVQTGGVQILPADTTAKKTVFTAGANGSKVEMFNIASTDTSARDIQVFLNDGTTDYLLTTIAVPANAGNTNSVPPVGLLTFISSAVYTTPNFQLPVDAMGNRFIHLKAGWSIKAASLTTVTATKAVSILVQGGDY